LKTSEFEYDLPAELIAQSPVEPRDSSRLFVVDRQNGAMQHCQFRDLPRFLHPGDLLIANESRVIPARLFGKKVPSGGKVELLLVSKRDECLWEALIKPGRRLKPGATISISAAVDGSQAAASPVQAQVLAVLESGCRLLRFSAPIEPLLTQVGVMPLPPYIHMPLQDPERYQTVYARVRGSVAAPTAGLHFTPALIDQLGAAGVEFAFVTLNISLDTFRPVQEELVQDHQMYSEYCELPEQTCMAINRARHEGRRVIAVGTTSVRVLETVGARLPRDDAPLAPFVGPTNLYIFPGFRFRVVDALLTNFHLPRSSLLMLTSAFAGLDLVKRAYAEAVRLRYRFYSFGDAMLIA